MEHQKIVPAWLTAYNGGSFFIDRVGRGKRYIKNFSIGIIGGIQPGPIRRIVSRQSADDGLLQRFIPIAAYPAKQGIDAAPNAIVHETWESLCAELGGYK